jgi:hypothetical protein
VRTVDCSQEADARQLVMPTFTGDVKNSERFAYLVPIHPRTPVPNFGVLFFQEKPLQFHTVMVDGQSCRALPVPSMTTMSSTMKAMHTDPMEFQPRVNVDRVDDLVRLAENNKRVVAYSLPFPWLPTTLPTRAPTKPKARVTLPTFDALDPLTSADGAITGRAGLTFHDWVHWRVTSYLPKETRTTLLALWRHLARHQGRRAKTRARCQRWAP